MNTIVRNARIWLLAAVCLGVSLPAVADGRHWGRGGFSYRVFGGYHHGYQQRYVPATGYPRFSFHGYAPAYGGYGGYARPGYGCYGYTGYGCYGPPAFRYGPWFGHYGAYPRYYRY